MCPKELLPKVSVIIPTYNCSQYITQTLESVQEQTYPDYEVIIIDARSRDRTVEIVKSFYDRRIRVCSVATAHRFEMINKGISLAKGDYLNFLFPGDFYLSKQSIEQMVDLAVEYAQPHLLYGAYLLRDRDSDVRLLFYPLSREELQRGKQPTSLQSCLFHQDTFRVIGKFSHQYKTRGVFDLFCRFQLHSQLRVIGTKRVFTDYIVRPISRREALRHFSETFKIISLYFGRWNAFRWVWIQRDIRHFFSLCMDVFKTAFSRQRT